MNANFQRHVCEKWENYRYNKDLLFRDFKTHLKFLNFMFLETF